MLAWSTVDKIGFGEEGGHGDPPLQSFALLIGLAVSISQDLNRLRLFTLYRAWGHRGTTELLGEEVQHGSTC